MDMVDNKKSPRRSEGMVARSLALVVEATSSPTSRCRWNLPSGSVRSTPSPRDAQATQGRGEASRSTRS